MQVYSALPDGCRRRHVVGEEVSAGNRERARPSIDHDAHVRDVEHAGVAAHRGGALSICEP